MDPQVPDKIGLMDCSLLKNIKRNINDHFSEMGPFLAIIKLTNCKSKLVMSYNSFIVNKYVDRQIFADACRSQTQKHVSNGAFQVWKDI